MTARHPRLYLSSYRLGVRAEVLRREGGRALVVLDALDEYPDRRRGWQREADDLAGLAAVLAATPGIVYAGYSAGACLASVDLAGIELMDDPATLPEGYRADTPATALGLLDTRVIPHAGTPDADRARESLDARGIDHVELADGDDLLVGW